MQDRLNKMTSDELYVFADFLMTITEGDYRKIAREMSMTNSDLKLLTNAFDKFQDLEG